MISMNIRGLKTTCIDVVILFDSILPDWTRALHNASFEWEAYLRLFELKNTRNKMILKVV